MNLTENSLTFHLVQDNEPKEIIKITKEGFFYKGERIDDVYNVYEKFHEWLQTAMIENPN